MSKTSDMIEEIETFVFHTVRYPTEHPMRTLKALNKAYSRTKWIWATRVDIGPIDRYRLDRVDDMIFKYRDSALRSIGGL